MEPLDFLIAWLVTGSSLLLISQLPIGVEIDRKARRKPLALDTGKSRQRFQPPSFPRSSESRL